MFIPIHRLVSTNREAANMKHIAYNKIYSGNSLSVYKCLTAFYITAGAEDHPK